MVNFGRQLGELALCGAAILLLCTCGAHSSGATAREGGPDVTPPVVTGSDPSGPLPAGTTETTLTVETDEPATCRYDQADVAYASMAGAFTDAGVTHTVHLTGLASGTTYSWRVRCADDSGNAAGTSYLATFRVASGTPTILWHDDIQGTSPQLGFDGFGVEHPIGIAVTPADANGANLSRVANPLPGGGYAMRHYGSFDAGGARAQAGLYGDINTVFGNQAMRPEGVWVAQEWYFPQAITANGDPWCWLAVWDWHSVAADPPNRSSRWATSPGLLVARDGSMRLQLVWGQGPDALNGGEGPTSTIAMPVGRWFDIEMHYEWTASKTGTIQVWIDGQLAIEQKNVQTRAASHAFPETYMKFYGSTQGHGPWVPTPTLKYTRNVRVAGERIWR